MYCTANRGSIVPVLAVLVLGLLSSADCSCLGETEGRYNIGCLTSNGSQICFDDGVNGSSPYDHICDGTPDCGLGVDEDASNNNPLLNCGVRRYQCSDNTINPSNSIELTRICDGKADCSLGDDETNVLCSDKCRGDFNGGCPANRQCTSSYLGTSCGSCYEGFLEQPNNDCLPEPVNVFFDMSVYMVNSSTPYLEVCVNLEVLSSAMLGERVIYISVSSVDDNALAGVDYNPVNMTLSFNESVRRSCFVVQLTVNATEFLEDIERFFIVLANPAPVTVSDVRFENGSQAIVYITDVSDITFNVSSANGTSVSEESREVVFAYSYQGVAGIGSDVSVVVTVSVVSITADSNDFELLTSELVLNSSHQPMETRYFSISIVDDSLIENSEGFEVHFDTSNGRVRLARSVITITILDNDPLQAIVLVGNLSEITEGDEFTVTLSFLGQLGFQNRALTITVINIFDGSALFSTNITVAAGMNNTTISSMTLAIPDDNAFGMDRQISFGLEGAILVQSPTLTLLEASNLVILVNEGEPVLQVSEEGMAAVLSYIYTQPLGGIAPNTSLTIPVSIRPGSASDGEDFMTPNTNLSLVFEPTVMPGDVQSIYVPLIDDNIVESEEAFLFVLGQVDNPRVIVNGSRIVNVSIQDNDALSVSFEVETYPSTEGDSLELCLLVDTSLTTIPLTVLVNAVDDTAIDTEDYVISRNAITIDSGPVLGSTNCSVALSVQVLRDSFLEEEERFNVTLSSASGFEGQLIFPIPTISVTIEDTNRELELIFPTRLVIDENTTDDVMVNVFLVSPQLQTPVQLSVRTSGGSANEGEDFTLLDQDITFTSSNTTQVFAVRIIDDSVFEDTEYFTVELSAPSGIDIANNTNITFIITNNDVNPCDPSPCHEEAMCSVDGNLTACSCNLPYVGDGLTCRRVDPCYSTPYSTPCDLNATCVLVNESISNNSALSGSGSSSGSSSGIGSGNEDVFECICDALFVGNGTHCELYDPCDEMPCGANAICERVVGNDSTVGFNCISMSFGDDPHFSVTLPSKKMLCYTIQGDHNTTYNLLSNSRMQINAMFVPDSHRKEVTWIGSLGFTFGDRNYPSLVNKTTLKLLAVGAVISLNMRTNLSARNIDTIKVTNGKFAVSEAAPVEGFRFPFVHIILEDVGMNFSVMFKGQHLDLFWHSTQLQREDSHGLIGQFFRKGVEIDEVRKLLLLPGMEPLPVAKRPVWSYMERQVKSDQTCWTAMNYGYQGVGLILGSYREYAVRDLLQAGFELK